MGLVVVGMGIGHELPCWATKDQKYYLATRKPQKNTTQLDFSKAKKIITALTKNPERFTKLDVKDFMKERLAGLKKEKLSSLLGMLDGAKNSEKLAAAISKLLEKK